MEIVREVCGIVGILRPSTVVGSGDTGVRQLVGLLNAEGRQLSARYGWEALTREATFATVAAEDQGAIATLIGVPNAYRYIVNETLFNRSRKEPICGPHSSMDWQLLKTLDLSGPFTEYRIRGGRLLFTPAPAAGESVYFEYVTRNWCTSEAGDVQRSAIAADTDVVLLSDEIAIAGLEWRWRKAKGLSYAEEFRAYESLVADATARDGTKRRANLAGTSAAPERRIAVSPGSWPLT